MLDAMRAHEQGVGSIADIDTGMMAGASHPMGPLTLADFVGLDTLVSISSVMVDAYGEDRFAAPDILRKMVDAGDLGRKSGKGFYDYSGEKPVPDRSRRIGEQMGVDQTSLDRIRNATFPSSKRGYDKQEVEKFLSRLADWLETGGGDESRSETVKRELERVGERTGAILVPGRGSAQQIRSEAEAEAPRRSATANTEAEQTRTEADAYAEETRSCGRHLRRGDARPRPTPTPRTPASRPSQEAADADRRRRGQGPPHRRGGHQAPRGHRGRHRRSRPPPRRRARRHRGADLQADRGGLRPPSRRRAPTPSTCPTSSTRSTARTSRGRRPAELAATSARRRGRPTTSSRTRTSRGARARGRRASRTPKKAPAKKRRSSRARA